MHPRLRFDISWRRLLWAAFGPKADEIDIDIPEARVVGLSVRTLFDAILSESGLDAGAPVIVSGVNIDNMNDIVGLHGLQPHPIDIATDTLLPTGERLLDAQTRTGARLCLVAHLFGTRSKVAGIAELRRRGVLVIEDMAQGFSRDLFERPPEADVTLLSFGPIKRRTALGGGAALFRDPDLADRVRRRIAGYRSLGDTWFRARVRKYLLLKAISHPALYGLVFALAGRDPDARIAKLARGFADGDLLSHIRRRPPPRLLHLLAKQIADDEGLAARRRVCEDFLASLPPGFRLGDRAASHVHWLVPVDVPEPEAFIRILRRCGFDATRGATSLRALTGPNAVASALMAHIVYLPHPADMDTRARTRLSAAVVKALAGQ